MRGFAVLFSMLPFRVVAEHWAVIIATSNGWVNYRHQADACHAYQVARSKGIAEDHIIMMAYDDIANNPRNPFPGKLFNKPDPNGPGVDVYAGCNIDYKGDAVTPETFLNVLTGRGSSIEGGNGRSLQSTSEDNVFIFLTDHGAPGLLAFPGSDFKTVGVLHKSELQNALQTMSDKGMFNKLTFYLEACESGSMFEDMRIPSIYALSAANATEESWATYCGRGHWMVNGINFGTCLGDLFSVNWIEDAEASDTTKESLETAFHTIYEKTTGKHEQYTSAVTQGGDRSFTTDKVSEFIGNLNTNLKMAEGTDPAASAVGVRQLDLMRLYSLYTSATTSAERLQVGEELQQELASQMAVDSVYTKFLELVFPGEKGKQDAMRVGKETPTNYQCEVLVHKAFQHHGAHQFNANSGFALQFHQIVVNVCAAFSDANGPPIEDLVAAVKRACEGGFVV